MSAMFYGILGFSIGFFVGYLVTFLMSDEKAIINLINKWACHHDWELKKEIEVECDYGTIYHKFIYVCKKCGKFKTINSKKI